MNNNPFRANSWLNSGLPSLSVNDGSVERQANEEKEQNFLGNFLIPDWKGESLASHASIDLRKTTNLLIEDARNQFTQFVGLNRTLKQNIFNEFTAFANDLAIAELESFDEFWLHLHSNDENSPHFEVLEKFKDVYCFRAVTIYLFKIRFISLLSEELSITPSENNLLNPASFLSKIFRAGSSSELVCDSLKCNQYSWFRPSCNFKDSIKKVSSNLSQMSISEFMKSCVYGPKSERNISVNTVEDKQYSHSLSHRSFGLFINNLLVFLPQWLKKDEKKFYNNKPRRKAAKVINCKFLGSHLNSLVHSHWLAQKHNIDLLWEEILCPDFTSENFTNGNFTRLCHELQFLTYLVKVSKVQKQDPIYLICNVIKNKYSKPDSDRNGQICMFPQVSNKSGLNYHRTVVNLPDSPKTNPHHHLLQQINKHSESICEEGYLYILTNQKLFVPSQSEKVEQLLKGLKLEAYFNFENLHGKGEIPNYTYVFSKRTLRNHNELLSPLKTQHEEESCLSFKWDGNLSIFRKFSFLVNELQSFLQNNDFKSPIYQSEVRKDLSFEFFQDVIIDGKLLHSQGSDPQNITHPNFFKNLTRACHPFDQVFQIEQIHNSAQLPQRHELTSRLLGQYVKKHDLYSTVLIVDYRDKKNIQIEIIPTNGYSAKREKYGDAFFCYFGLSVKQANVNINTLKEFFNNPIGRQVIQLSLGGGSTKLKSKLNSMLIPKFLTKHESLPSNINNLIEFMRIEEEKLINLHPDQINLQHNAIKPYISQISEKYPTTIFSNLCYFKHTIGELRYKFQNQSKTTINYSNPLISAPLQKLGLEALYPSNNEAYIKLDFKISDDINKNCDHFKILVKDESHCLELRTGDIPMIEIYSDPDLLQFIQYILTNSPKISYKCILQNFKVPRIQELKSVLTGHLDFEKTLTDLFDQTNFQLNQIILKQISTK